MKERKTKNNMVMENSHEEEREKWMEFLGYGEDVGCEQR
jgi:hypothetical protein